MAEFPSVSLESIARALPECITTISTSGFSFARIASTSAWTTSTMGTKCIPLQSSSVSQAFMFAFV